MFFGDGWRSLVVRSWGVPEPRRTGCLRAQEITGSHWLRWWHHVMRERAFDSEGARSLVNENTVLERGSDDSMTLFAAFLWCCLWTDGAWVGWWPLACTMNHPPVNRIEYSYSSLLVVGGLVSGDKRGAGSQSSQTRCDGANIDIKKRHARFGHHLRRQHGRKTHSERCWRCQTGPLATHVRVSPQ